MEKRIEGKIVGFSRKGSSGLPEITISFPKVDDTTTIPLNKEVEIHW